MTDEEFKDIEDRAKRTGLPFEVIKQMDYFQNYTASKGFGHGRNNVFRIALQNEIYSAIDKAKENLKAENTKLREVLKDVLDHVEDDNVPRIENQCTLCKTYRDMIRAALEGKP